MNNEYRLVLYVDTDLTSVDVINNLKAEVSRWGKLVLINIDEALPIKIDKATYNMYSPLLTGVYYE